MVERAVNAILAHYVRLANSSSLESLLFGYNNVALLWNIIAIGVSDDLAKIFFNSARSVHLRNLSYGDFQWALHPLPLYYY